ncbi:IS110 family transposase [Ferruginibacter sp. SUN002]|uniref:IS110 family transposase n=1 Tax=Ferruginibacter sp. SUN002 TaxID=2937789 RepID=UPI003D360C3F
MKSKPLLCGIDVSQLTLDVCYNDKFDKLHTIQVKNNTNGHNSLIKKLGIKRTYVIESTGIYSLQLCVKLKKAGADVRVENSLVIKRFIQMNMERHKSDKRDAKWIYIYGKEREAAVWHMPQKEQFYCSQLMSGIELCTRNITIINNSIKSYEKHPFINKDVRTSLTQILHKTEKELKKLDKKLEMQLDKWNGDLKRNLGTIPSLGKRAIAFLIIYTDGFTKITNARKLIALAGTSPREFTSGTSVSSHKGICKMGYSKLRKTLYMCSLTAIKCNQPCKELYERLKAAGKPSKVALIAVCNKLLRQAFAIATKGTTFQPS